MADDFRFCAPEVKRLRDKIKNDTVRVAGSLFWKANKAPVPMSCFLEAGIPAPPTQAAAIRLDTERVIAQYREAMQNYIPSDEERYEMKAAFGEGVEVVNVFTGKRTRT